MIHKLPYASMRSAPVFPEGLDPALALKRIKVSCLADSICLTLSFNSKITKLEKFL